VTADRARLEKLEMVPLSRGDCAGVGTL